MATSSFAFGPADFKQLLDSINRSMEIETEKTVGMIWAAFLSYLAAHWLAIIVILFIIFVVVTLKAMMGQWGSLGSFIYNFLYFGTLLIIGLIWGPNVFLGDFFKAACTALLYPICFFITGYILKKTGLMK